MFTDSFVSTVEAMHIAKIPLEQDMVGIDISALLEKDQTRAEVIGAGETVVFEAAGCK